MTCLITLFKYDKNVYLKCDQTNLPLYITTYLIIPYMFFGKHKIIKAIKKTLRGDIDPTTKMEKIPGK